MRKCVICGKNVEESVKQCPFCGADLIAQQVGNDETRDSSCTEEPQKPTMMDRLGAMLGSFFFASVCFFMAFGPFQLRLFSIFGDVGPRLNMIVFTVAGALSVIVGIMALFLKNIDDR